MGAPPRRAEFGGCTPQEERFIVEYIRNGNNGKAAVIAAGYSPKDAAKTASRLLARHHVGVRMRHHLDMAAKANEVDVQRVVKEYARIGFLNPKRLFDEDGHLIPIQALDDEVAAAIASIEFEGVFEGSGKDRRMVGELAKIKFAPKTPALDSLAKFLGMFKDKGDTPPATDPVQMVKELLGIIDGRSAALPVKR